LKFVAWQLMSGNYSASLYFLLLAVVGIQIGKKK